MRMIKVRYRGLIRRRDTTFWVKESNPYFEWYKKNPFYTVLKEREI